MGSVGVLGIESHLDPLDLMAQLDGGPQLQLHALLHCGEGQQQERLAVDILPGDKAGLEPRRDKVHGGRGWGTREPRRASCQAQGMGAALVPSEPAESGPRRRLGLMAA